MCHQRQAQPVLRVVELREVSGAEALFVGGDAGVGLHHRAAQRDVQELLLALVLQRADGAFGVQLIGVPDGDGVQMYLRHVRSLLC